MVNKLISFKNTLKLCVQSYNEASWDMLIAYLSLLWSTPPHLINNNNDIRSSDIHNVDIDGVMYITTT